MELLLEEQEEQALGEKLAKSFKEKTGNDVEFFYKTERTKLIWYLRRFCNDNIQLATEIADQTFVDVFEGIHKYDETKSQFNTWLYTVARRVMMRTKVKVDVLDSIDVDSASENPKLKLPVCDLEYEIIEQQTLAQKMDIIMEGIKLLPERYAIIVTMREIDGLSYKDIEAALDICENTVKSRIHVGKKMLVEKIKPYLNQFAD